MRSLRWKLVLTTMIVVLIPVTWLHKRETRFFDTFSRAELERHILEAAFLVRGVYRSAYEQGRDPVEAVKDATVDYRRYGALRIRLLAADGQLTYDSDPAGYTFETRCADRPEVKTAITTKGYCAKTRHTPDHKYVYYYYALPVKTSNQDVLGVVYVSRHTRSIISAIKAVRLTHKRSLWFALAFAFGVAIFFAWTLTRRLRKLTLLVDQFAKGETGESFDVRGNDELATLGKAFNDMARQIETRQAYNSEFVAATIHELKAPLTAIKGAAEILQDGAAEKPETRDKFLGNIHYESERLIRLVGELNELARLDIEAIHPHRTKHDLAATLRELMERIEPGFPEPHAILVVHIPHTPIPVFIHVERMEQVIINLLDNAFRYTPTDGQVSLTVTCSAHAARIVVEDNGTGISAANVDRVFDRFFTTENRSRKQSYGSGLGLAIAKSIVEMHQGVLRVDSEPGAGCRFTVELPLV